MIRRQKYLAKELREYNLVSRVIDGETWFHDLGGLVVYYLSDIQFEQLDDGYTTEFILGVIFVTWCIVNLDYYVTLCRACHIIIVGDYIIHMGIKIISWRWVVGDVTNTPDFSNHI